MPATETLDEQLAFFEANDYVLMPEVLSRDEVDARSTPRSIDTARSSRNCGPVPPARSRSSACWVFPNAIS